MLTPYKFFNTARPHQGIEQQMPVPTTNHETTGPVRCRHGLGGIVHDYYRDAAQGEKSAIALIF